MDTEERLRSCKRCLAEGDGLPHCFADRECPYGEADLLVVTEEAVQEIRRRRKAYTNPRHDE